ncbi:flagellar basal body rod protein FlgC [Rheinheimera faecalis]|uniref:flagellar basal body rod protein FlgC n=1 Tax=Rheinheimera faecalis TaxID=2901141 RepID=UPI001E658F27|nr:flagellar basal body rod C-terminal domain-containing protein [Rheinheimera faecalis]
MVEGVYENSLLGMKLQRAEIEAASLNIANANRVWGNQADVAQPFSAVVQTSSDKTDVLLLPQNVPAKAIYQPENPQADAQGFIYTSDINMVEQMLILNKASRNYEANIKVFNAYREMGGKALEIGK